jgi:hypothetical protein
VLQDDDMTTFTSEDRLSATIDTFKWNPYQQQESIQFFWPLTEQISLPLDYSSCDTKKPYTIPTDCAIGTFAFNGFTTPTWTTSINVDSNNITITSKDVPPLYRRVLYKLLGINWKQS